MNSMRIGIALRLPSGPLITGRLIPADHGTTGFANGGPFGCRSADAFPPQLSGDALRAANHPIGIGVVFRHRLGWHRCFSCQCRFGTGDLLWLAGCFFDGTGRSCTGRRRKAGGGYNQNFHATSPMMRSRTRPHSRCLQAEPMRATDPVNHDHDNVDLRDNDDTSVPKKEPGGRPRPAQSDTANRVACAR